MRMQRAVLLMFAASFAGCDGPAGTDRPDVILGSSQIGTRRIDFYIDYGRDSAILGFSVNDQLKQPRFFPIYGSTYRGLPSVTLDVFLSDAEDEMWVLSSWKGYDVLAHYRVGSDHCMTGYGETIFTDTPTPKTIEGRLGDFPDMNAESVKKVLKVTHTKE